MRRCAAKEFRHEELIFFFPGIIVSVALQSFLFFYLDCRISFQVCTC
ncbi:hypothetical protein IFM89_004332 [Coptis chinensis]|uniref:Uncharacterized protein n=1 Tax=Coptis chinensis TaxID=261450 RepID=A0A835I7Y1_9MAGN|nr:hypothetical protein IFM89_004332 [Coptis chinensis]